MTSKLTKPIRWITSLFLKQAFLLLLFYTGGVTLIYAQEKGITLKMTNAKRTTVLNEIKKQVDMEFFYNVKELDKYGNISIDVKNKPLIEVIQELIKGTNLKYNLENGIINILLLGQETKSGKPMGTSLKVKGKVTDENGIPLLGVTIKDTSSGMEATTNANGNYEINSSRNTILQYSFIGSETTRISVNAVGTSEVTQNVQLKNTAIALNEVSISTGYQNIALRDVVGAVSTVKVEDIKVAGITSIDQLIQGQLPGVAVSNVSGIVGTSPKVRVRGTSTLLGNQEPVWVVDGIIQQDKLPFDYTLLNTIGGDGIRDIIGSSVSFLNVEDIDDVTVLKDASATAIYGVKAANGVIVITTKKGKIGPTRINYTTNFSMTPGPKYSDFNLMTSQERIDVSREIFARGLTFQFTPDNLSYEGYLTKLFEKQITQDQFNANVAKLETNNTDWFDLLYQNSFSQNHSVSASGGNDKLTYYTSLGYNNRIGNSIGNDQNVYNINLNLNANLSKKLKLGFRIGANSGKTNGYYQFNPFSYAYNTSRALPQNNDDGSRYTYKRGSDFASFNILSERENTGNTNTTYSFAPTTTIDYQIVKDLSFQSILGITYAQTNGESFASAQSYYIGHNFRRNEYGSTTPGTAAYLASYLPVGGVLNTNSTTNMAYTFRNTVNYKKDLRKEKDFLNVLAGVEIRSSKYDGLRQTNYGYLPDRGKTFAQIPTTYVPSSTTVGSPIIYSNIPSVLDQTSNFMSYFGTASYNLDHRYVLSATLRTDASNRFGQSTNNRFLPIWSAGLKWNVMEEKFFNDKLTWLSQFSPRASYGFQGNVAENFGPELILQYPTTSINPNTGEGIMTIKNLGYPDLRWEKTASSNLGIDVALFKGKVTGSFDYYHKKTTDLLAQVTIPVEYGVVSMPINAGDVVNKGYEIALNFVPISNKVFNWALNFNTAKNFNNITKSRGVNTTAWRAATTGGIYQEGNAISTIWAFDYAGLDGQTGYPNFNIPISSESTRKDVTQLMVPVGQLDPKFTGGFGTNMRYRGFTFNTSFNLSLGAHKFLAPLYATNYVSAPYPSQNLPSDLNGRWRSSGDESFTNIPSLPTANMPKVLVNTISESAYEIYDYSTSRVVKADYLRCRNIALGYQLSQKSLSKSNIKSLNVQASVSNPFYFAGKSLNGIDPEVVGNSLPIPRTYSLTLNLGI